MQNGINSMTTRNVLNLATTKVILLRKYMNIIIAKVRYHLCESGWKIDREDMVLEDGKYYPMMHCIPGKMELTPEEALYGPDLLSTRHPVLWRYLRFRETVLNSNLESLQNASSERARERMEQIREEISRIQAILKNE